MLLLLAAQLLQPGTIIDRDIKTGDSHKYELALQQGQYLHCTAFQQNIDLALLLDNPKNETVTALNRLWWEGAEDLPWLAESTGTYTISVDGKQSNGPASYKLACQVRQPAELDKTRARAYHSAWREGLHWNGRQDAESRKKALAAYETALPLWRQLNDASWEAWTLSQAALIYDDIGDIAKAIDFWSQAVTLRRKIPIERYGLAISLNSLGTTLNDIGENERALPLLEEAIEIRKAIGDRRGEGIVRGNLGLVYFRLNEYDKALELYQSALEIRRAVKDRLGESTSLITTGNVYLARGEIQRALDTHIQALKIREELKNLNGQADAHGAIGTVYLTSGDYLRAAGHWQRAAALYTQTGAKLAIASANHNLGRIALANGDNTRAKSLFEDALTVRRAGGNRLGASATLAALCETALARSDVPNAIGHAREGLAIAREIKSRAGIGSNLQCLAQAELRASNTGTARQLLNEALDTFRTIGAPDEQSRVLALLAASTNNLADALTLIEQSAKIAGAMRGAVASSNLRAAFRAARADRIDLHTEILMRLHAQYPKQDYAARAFNLTERWRARSLVEMMGEARAELRQDLTPEQSDREEKLIGAIASAQRVLFRPNLPEARRKQIEQQLTAAEHEFELFQIELRRAGNRYAAGQYTPASDVRTIQEQLSANTALIEFAVAEKQSYAWVVTPAGIKSAELPGRAAIESRIDAFRKLAARPGNTLTASAALTRIDAEASAIYRDLLAPLEPALKSVTQLTIVPDGILAYLPFEALPTPKGRLVERFRVAYAPSASALNALKQRNRKPPPRSLLAFADPAYGNPPALVAERGFDFTRLPQTRAEVAAIRTLFPVSKVFVGAEADEHALKSADLENFQYLHIAAHGYFDEQHPARSGVVLTPGQDDDGVLQAHEVMRLRLNADLVTLSACQTGLGKLLAGEGVLSLSRAFFYAGAQSTVVSLWNVNDAATAQLMKSFYTNLTRGLPRDEALRQAKLAMLKSTAWRHPYFWAPFIFTGNPY